MPRIFISYRKADSAASAEKIDRLLHDLYKRVNVLVNLVALPGETLEATVKKAIASCDVVLVIIGAQWLKILDSRGIPRLHNPDDLNRVEVETAIKTKRMIIPVLVDGAAMPSPDDLPPALRELASLNAIVLRPEPDFAEDFKRLRWVIDGAFPSEAAKPAIEAESSPKKRIMIIDDEASILTLLSVLFERSGYAVSRLADPTSAFALIQQDMPDILLIDVMMPEIDGFELCKQIKSNPDTRHLPVALMGQPGISGISDLDRLRTGADDYINKPFSPNEVIMRVKALLERYELLSPPKTPVSATTHLFLSYSRRDTQVMQRLRDDLRAAQVSVWVDEEGLEPGTPAWEAAIGKAIRGANCVLVVLSPDAEQSMWVGRELAMAETLNKRIFPVLVRGTEQDAIPFRLMTHQWIDARQDYAGAFDKLLGAVKKHLGMS